MEPQNATAIYTAGKVEVWSSWQDWQEGLSAYARHFGYARSIIRIGSALRNPPVQAHFWRRVTLNQIAIKLECFPDELAKDAGVAALDFRRKHMGPYPKHHAVLNAAAEKAGWGKPAP